MKKLAFILMVAVSLTACSDDDDNSDTVTNAQMVTELLKSIETGASEPIAYINPNKYIQHNQSVADGLAGFGEVLAQLPEGSAKVNTVRIFEDGDYVIAHTDYDFFGPKVGFDIFRFEDGLIVEHWDNLQELVNETVSGRTQLDGPTTVEDLDKTEANKLLVTNFVNEVLLGGNPEVPLTNYISAEQYHQHNPGVADGIDGLVAALTALAEAGTPMIYNQNHIVLGQGNFVLSVSEGIFLGENVAFYDLFRVEDSKIVEHWDAIETILPEEEAHNTNGKFNF